MEDHGWQRVGTASLDTASRGQWTAKRGLAGRWHSGTLHSGGEPKHSDGRIATAQQGNAAAPQGIAQLWLSKAQKGQATAMHGTDKPSDGSATYCEAVAQQGDAPPRLSTA